MIELLTRLRRARGHQGQRRLRLFVCASCRHAWEKLSDERSRQAVVASEHYADGAISAEELARAREQAGQAAREQEETMHAMAYGMLRGAILSASSAADAAFASTWDEQVSAAKRAARGLWLGFEQRFQCDILRDIFGNPFRLMPAVDPSWLAWHTDTIPRLAQSIYDERAFDRLPILADALEDAGCDNADILTHCRQPGEHVRGCWVVDLLLRKE
jgi:hypothetical protein